MASSKGNLMVLAWAASMRAVFGIMVGSCMSCGTLKSTWVKNAIVLDGHLIDLPLIQDRILFVAAGASPSALETSMTMCLIRSMTQQEQPYTVSSLHTTFTKVVPSLMPALGAKVKEMEVVSKSVDANASSTI